MSKAGQETLRNRRKKGRGKEEGERVRKPGEGNSDCGSGVERKDQ